jgi:CRISPR type III-A-associated RAMP protein Csm4
MRSTAAVDRLTRTGDEVRSVACVEFEQTAGLWTVARFADSAQEQAWSGRLQAALRLLSDSGFGGGRGKGWGQTQAAEFQAGLWPGLLLPKLGRFLRNSQEQEVNSALYWLLSLYSPAASDKIDWAGGDYSLTLRGGRVESNSGQGGGVKKNVRMVNEGCVLASAAEPVGSAVDVAPDGFAHPVYRSGLALALRLPVVEIRPQEQRPVEEPATEEAVIQDLPLAEEAAEPEAPVEPEVPAEPEIPVEEPGPPPPPQEEPPHEV